MRVGDIVRTPPGGFYGDQPAIVTKVDKGAICVHSKTAELWYEKDLLTPLATIEITKRAYSTRLGNWFHVCFLRVNGASQPQEIHVKTGDRVNGVETRALEIRKMVFLSHFA